MSPPDWLEQLAQAISLCIDTSDPRSRIGCHYCCVDNVWEVTLFVSRTEIFGGEFDGCAIPGRFTLDIGGLLHLLEEVHRGWWQPLSAGSDDDLGPHLSLEGISAGHRVWIRITAEQPLALESGRVANMIDGTIERRW